MKKLVSVSIICVLLTAILSACGGTVSTEDMVHIILESNKEVSSEELSKNAKIIEERSKELGGSYKTETGENKIDFWIGKDLITDDADEEQYLLSILLAEGNFNVSAKQEEVEFVKDDFESITVENDTAIGLYNKFEDQLKVKGISGYEAYYDKLEDDSKVYYLHIKLTDEASAKFKNIIDQTENAQGSDKVINTLFKEEGGKHIGSSNIFGRALTSDNNSSEMYIVNSYLDNEKVENLIKHILTGDRISVPMKYRVDYKPVYETGDEITGKYQKDSISGNAIEVNTSVYYSTTTSGEQNPTKLAADNMKDELDTLGIDYAIGYYGLGNRDVVARFAPEDVGRVFIRLIAENKSVKLCNAQKDFRDTVTDIKLTKDENGNNCFAVEYSASLSSPKIADAADGETIYLKVNDVTVASVPKPALNPDEKKGTVNFSNMVVINEDSISDDKLKIAEFVVKCSEEPKERFSQTLSSAQYRDEQGNKVDDDIKWGYDCETEITKSTIKAIETQHPVAQAYMSSTAANTLIIKLDIPTDDKLPETFMSEVKSIYVENGLNDGTFRNVFFVKKDEDDNSTMDYCRVIYNKVTYSSSEDVMKPTLLVSGPTYDKYDDKFAEVIDGDEFFKEQKWTS